MEKPAGAGALCKSEKPVLSLGEGGEMLLETGDKAGISEPLSSCSNPSQTGAVWAHTGYCRLSSRQEQSLSTEEQKRGTST